MEASRKDFVGFSQPSVKFHLMVPNANSSDSRVATKTDTIRGRGSPRNRDEGGEKGNGSGSGSLGTRALNTTTKIRNIRGDNNDNENDNDNNGDSFFRLWHENGNYPCWQTTSSQVFAANLVTELRTFKMLQVTVKFDLNKKLMSCQRQLKLFLD